MEREMEMLPWFIGFGTAVWFGVMARRAGVRNRLSWAAGGAVLGLVATTMVLGLGRAVFLPLSHQAVILFRIKTGAAVLGIVGFLGWVCTLSLQRWYAGWRQQPGAWLRRERNNQDHDLPPAAQSGLPSQRLQHPTGSRP